MRRVIFYAYSMDGGGAEKACQLLANRFSKDSNYKVYMLLLVKRGVYLKNISQSVRIISYPAFLSHFKVFNLLALAYYVRTTKANCLVSFAEWPNFYAGLIRSLSRRKVHKVFSEQNTKTFVTEHKSYGVSSLVNYLSVFAYKRADEIVCCSHSVCQSVKSILPNSPTAVVYNPVDCVAARKLANENDSPSFDLLQLNFVAVGRLHPQKDYEMMLHAFDKAYQINNNIVLYVLGDGDQRNFLESLANKLQSKNSIVFMGFQDNPYSFLSKADALLHSALFEGFGNVFVESLAVGTPVITTDCNTPREIMSDPLHGTIVPVSDVDALAEGILRQPKKDKVISDSCIQRSKKFDIEQCFVQYKATVENSPVNYQ